MIARIALVVALLACVIAPASAANKLKAVATFSIIGDLAGEIAGDRIELTTLVGADSDAHAFEPTTADARALAQAQVVFANGLGFEPWLDRLMQSSGSKARLATLSQGVKAKAAEGGGADPHAWQDARNAIVYVDNVARALIAADPENAQFYRSNAEHYRDELGRLDAEIRAAIVKIAARQRRVITSHDAFGYFSVAYGVTFLAPLGATEREASAKQVAALIAQIKHEKITAVFVENIADPRLIDQIARETGTKLGGRLYSDALSKKGGPAATYIAMMRHNAKLLTDAMSRGL